MMWQNFTTRSDTKDDVPKTTQSIQSLNHALEIMKLTKINYFWCFCMLILEKRGYERYQLLI